MLELCIKNENMSVVEADEIGLEIKDSTLVLPCGASGRCYREL